MAPGRPTVRGAEAEAHVADSPGTGGIQGIHAAGLVPAHMDIAGTDKGPTAGTVAARHLPISIPTTSWLRLQHH
jgi:hypothetical protein